MVRVAEGVKCVKDEFITESAVNSSFATSTRAHHSVRAATNSSTPVTGRSQT